jgi:hypothetical protein
MFVRFSKILNYIIFTGVFFSLTGCATRYLIESDRYHQLPGTASYQYIDAMSH